MADNQTIAGVILAAGEGKRMESNLPKVLHEVADKPLLFYTIETLEKLHLGQIITVLKYRADMIKERLTAFPTVTTAIQGDQYGSGQALADALPVLDEFTTDILVVYGDNAMFVEPETYQTLIDQHYAKHNTITFATRNVDTPKSSGKIIRDSQGALLGIVEKKDATPEQLAITEVNTGCYIFHRAWVEENIANLTPSDVTGEYYITNLIGMALSQKKPVEAINLGKTDQWKGVTTQQDIEQLNDWIRTQND